MPRLAALLLPLTLLLSDAPDARQLMARSTPAEMERRLEADRSLVPSTLGILATALGGDDPALVKETGDYLAAAARSRSRRLGAAGRWQPGQVEDLLVLQLVQPERFVTDAAFRQRVLDLLPRALDPAVPPALRDGLLAELNQVRGVDFAASERVESAWGAVPRRSGERRTAYPSPAPRFGHDTGGALAASVYSLSSTFFSAEEATSFLAAVHEAAPERRLLVLTDPPLQRALAGSPGVRLLPTYGRPYSPWPRDPFSLAREPGGRLLVLLRPNTQPGREEDLFLGRELVQNLPGDLDKAWGQVHWAEAPVPFHNGQILLTPDAVWLSLHSLEPHILQILGLSRVPVESFGTAAGIDRYQEAAGKAARELAAFYGRPVRFVHPLAGPGTGDIQARRRLLGTLGGGAGYDLDSLLTLLPRPDGGLTALVADVSEGRRLLAALPGDDWLSLERGYGLAPAAGSGPALRERVAAAQETAEASRLDGFLDLVAEHLKKEGLQVRRLPLLAMPVALLRDRAGLEHDTFLLTWNNVVVETRGDLRRAEGFSSLLPTGDRDARAAFAAAGVRLDLFPPLVRSVVLNGGYRCASNHIRG
ncbi:MAG TPA: hypothetical protein VEL74_20450 [Thermoanaerobaculia bacterium]|nr:hypothetical protein [Thermoanaerobaculia bacterium]